VPPKECSVNYGRIAISGVAATIVFFIYGFLVHGLLIAADNIPILKSSCERLRVDF
jgi:hypothetical protein